MGLRLSYILVELLASHRDRSRFPSNHPEGYSPSRSPGPSTKSADGRDCRLYRVISGYKLDVSFSLRRQQRLWVCEFEVGMIILDAVVGPEIQGRG